MNTQTNIAILLRPEKNTVTYFSYTVTYFLFYGVSKKTQKRAFSGAHFGKSIIFGGSVYAPKNAVFWGFLDTP